MIYRILIVVGLCCFLFNQAKLISNLKTEENSNQFAEENSINYHNDKLDDKNISNELIKEEGRGKFHKYRKTIKYLYPLVVGLAIAKAIIIPLLFKTMIALTSMSFVMSKIALITSGLLVFKWILQDSPALAKVGSERTKLEIFQVPSSALKQQYHGWPPDDINVSGSSNINRYQQQKYIPLAGGGYNDGNDAGDFLGKPFL